ncbi:MAG: hypothetical protein Q9214_004798 [Letrouitia sp. 1 TL-2023]
MQCTRVRRYDEPVDLEKDYPVSIRWNKLALKPALERQRPRSLPKNSNGNQSHRQLSKVSYPKNEELQVEYTGTVMQHIEESVHGPAAELILQCLIGRYREVDDIRKQVSGSKGKSWKKGPKRTASKPASGGKTKHKLNEESRQSQAPKARCIVNGDLDENPKIVHDKTTGRKFYIVSR